MTLPGKSSSIVWCALLAGFLSIPLGSCGAKIPETFYYRLELPSPPPAQREPSPFSAILMPVRVSRMLAQERIVYRPAENEVGFYEYHRWAESPSEMFTSALLDHLRARNTFESVVPFDGRTVADYIVRSRLEKLEEIDFRGGVSVHVQLSAELLEVESRRAVWQGIGEGTGEVSAAQMRHVVAQMNDAAQDSIQELADGIDHFLRSSAPPPSARSSQRPLAAQN